MANIKSSQKAARQAEKRAARNKPIRSAVKTYLKHAASAVAAGAEEAADRVRLAVSALDKAAQKGVIHRNAAARRTSRLMARMHALHVAGAEGLAAQAAEAAPARKTQRGKAAARPAARAARKVTNPGGAQARDKASLRAAARRSDASAAASAATASAPPEGAPVTAPARAAASRARKAVPKKESEPAAG